jgi:membrane-associated phospholipid phosphatase
VASLAIATSLLLITAQRSRSTAVRLLASLTAVLVAASVAIALVARHVHYATDTLAGFCVAVATVLALALTLDFVARIRVRTR